MLHQLNKQGAALLQVLILSAVLAGMATMVLRVSLSRTVTANQSKHQVVVQKKIESCMTQVNMLWASKTPDAYGRDLALCQMCSSQTVVNGGDACDNSNFTVAGRTFKRNKVYACGDGVYAVMETNTPPCQITYLIADGVDL